MNARPRVSAAGLLAGLLATASLSPTPATASFLSEAPGPSSDAARTVPQAEAPLPTPIEHYEAFDAEAEARSLAGRVMLELDPDALRRIAAWLGPNNEEQPPSLSRAEAMELLQGIDLEAHRAALTELLLHTSRVLDLIPEGSEDWVPLVHDSLLVVLSGMSIERIRERIAQQAALPVDAPRGQRILAFGSETPTFQKIGQMLARNAWIPEDIRGALQTLENSISTTPRDQLVATIEEGLGTGLLEQYQFEFEDEVLSEASVGAVIGASIIPPGEIERRRVVVKAIKAYAVTAIDEDLQSVTRLLELLERNADFYGIGDTPLVDTFAELQDSLAREIRAAEEQVNLKRAGDYFGADARVLVPAVCPCSTREITVMERMEGTKVTEAFPEDPARRKQLARRLADVMIYEVTFAPGDALFHGDPHAGNVFAVGNDTDPYRIALLDWGLLGDLSHEQRTKLLQVGLGLSLKHRDRLRKNIDGMLDAPVDLETDLDAIDGVIDRVFARAEDAKRSSGEDPGNLELLDDLITELSRGGYTTDPDIILWVKSLFTTLAVISDLDPEFEAGDYMSARVRNQVLKESPKRLLNTIWIPGFWSREYPSMGSNADVWASALNSVGLGFKAVGVGIWKGVSWPFRR